LPSEFTLQISILRGYVQSKEASTVPLMGLSSVQQCRLWFS